MAVNHVEDAGAKVRRKQVVVLVVNGQVIEPLARRSRQVDGAHGLKGLRPELGGSQQQRL